MTEQQVRRLARKRGLELRKYRGAKALDPRGPYAIVDPRINLVQVEHATLARAEVYLSPPF